MERSGQTVTHVVPGIEDLVVIGRGGAAVVYRGRQPALDRDVAVKVVWSRGTPEADLARWQREVTAMARLSNHPNIVAVYDGGTTADGLPYLVMPFVPGGTLGDRMRAEGPLPAADVVAIGGKLAGALAAAHAAGVLHRDLKPDNVLLSQYGEPQLSDFGIARLLDATATATGNVHATVAYAAPEILNGQPASEASDVYGLGATLHACLTGAAPYVARDGEPLVSLAVRVVSDVPPDLRAAGVPDAVAAVIEAAMAKDPRDRIPTADELTQRLEQIDTPSPGLVAPVRTEPAPTTVAPQQAAVPVVQPQPQPQTQPTQPQPTQSQPAAAPVVQQPEPQPAPVRHQPPPAPAARPPARRDGGRRLLAVLAAVVVVVLGALTALVLEGRDSDNDADPDAGAQAQAPTTTTVAPPADDGTVPSSAPPSTATSGDVSSAALAYFEAIGNGDLEAAYAMTTPGFQDAQPFEGYVDFWSGLGAVSVDGEPVVDEDALSATVDLRFAGGGERYTLQFVRGDGGTLLVDGPRPR